MRSGRRESVVGGVKKSSARGEDLAQVELIAIARIVKVRGIRGEVAAVLLTDFPERFDKLAEVIAINRTGERSVLTLENHWFHGGRVILKIDNYDTPEASAVLVGLELTVPETDAVELEAGEFYDWHLAGCLAESVDGTMLGTVREVLHLGGDAPLLVIVGESGREQLVPFAESICVEIDTGRKLIRVDAPEGLLEL